MIPDIVWLIVGVAFLAAYTYVMLFRLTKTMHTAALGVIGSL